MILVIKGGKKGGKVIAYHEDGQDVLDKYPNCAIVRIKDEDVVFDEEGWPQVPQSGIELRIIGNMEQRIADLEAALVALLGVGGGT